MDGQLTATIQQKIYDLLLYQRFRAIKPPEEVQTGTAAT